MPELVEALGNDPFVIVECEITKNGPERRPQLIHLMPVVADEDIGRKPIQWGYATNDTSNPCQSWAQKIAAGANCQLAPLGRLAPL